NYHIEGLHFEIVGQKHRDSRTQVGFQKKSNGTKLILKREPNNPHDKNAIAVYAAIDRPSRDSYSYNGNYSWEKVGYIAHFDNQNAAFKDLSSSRLMEATKLNDDTLVLTANIRTYY